VPGFVAGVVPGFVAGSGVVPGFVAAFPGPLFEAFGLLGPRPFTFARPKLPSPGFEPFALPGVCVSTAVAGSLGSVVGESCEGSLPQATSDPTSAKVESATKGARDTKRKRSTFDI
jgi:hypothetical protein